MWGLVLGAIGHVPDSPLPGRRWINKSKKIQVTLRDPSRAMKRYVRAQIVPSKFGDFEDFRNLASRVEETSKYSCFSVTIDQ